MTQRGLSCSYTLNGEEGFRPPEIEVTVYRIAQEALTNALRHARAIETTMELTYSSDSLRLCIHDDGRGFQPEDASRAAQAPIRPDVPEPRSGLGLLGMRERAALIGATLDITSAPGQGTTVALAVPLGEPPVPSRLFSFDSDDDDDGDPLDGATPPPQLHSVKGA